MNSEKIRAEFLNFFKKREHVVVPSSSLIPDDPSVLLTSAGMQQFKPYYTGKADPITSLHPTLGSKPLGSKNAASVQKCFRTSDIDEVGDETHLTFFEMLGNFSFGGYFKKEAIQYAYDFIKELGLKIEYVTVFEGDPSTGSGQVIPEDKESSEIWQSLGVADVRKEGRADNFWGPTGSEGPCGPTTEIYIKDTEVWNIVFNEYYCRQDGSLEKLKTPGVDTGMGMERLTMVAQNTSTIFETDLFSFILEKLPSGVPAREQRIIADHLRGATFLLADGVRPSNKEAGYILRRLIRRTLVYENIHQISSDIFIDIIQKIIVNYSDFYPELKKEREIIVEEFQQERERFSKTLKLGLSELGKIGLIGAKEAFWLYETFGLPYEIVKEIGKEKAASLNREQFEEEFKKHQEISRKGQEKKFGGHGLVLDTGELKAADQEELEKVTRLHTATHLLQAALRKVLGDKARQAGSDITVERTRFDFTFDRKVTKEELSQIEDLVNEAIKENLTVEFKEMPYEEAIKTGALYAQKEKYPAVVRVYSVFNPKGSEVFSRELCGGPHVERTGELGNFKIIKEESSSAAIRRIRAKLST